jgi:4-hydroxybenzoate polyprenyltransferase
VGVARKLADLVLFTNIFVAFAVAALTFQTVLLSVGRTDLRYPAFVFFATLFLYNFHRVYRMHARSADEQMEKRHVWVKENKAVFHSVFILAVAGLAFTAIAYLDRDTLFLLAPAVLIAFAYSLPVFPMKKKWRRLRDVPGIKIFLIVFVLAWVTVVVPSSYYHADAMSKRYFYSSGFSPNFYPVIERMLFIFAITIPFDIRDMEHDARSGLKTIPVMLGERTARKIAQASLVLFILVIMMHAGKWDWPYALTMTASAIAAMLIISRATKERKEYFYSLGVEGTMILQAGLVSLVYFFR